ncbi:MAG: flagellar biosynthetic protein FliO [Chloroflexi bacterium]|nr:flagellar biosynthetic protein FliO [Chloroflexota bacterium]
MYRLIVPLLVALLPSAALGQTTDAGFVVRDYAELTAGSVTEPWWGLTLDLIVKLGLVIGLIYVTMWVLRRYVLGPQSAAAVGGRGGRLTLIETLNLAPGRTVHLISVADRVLVVGATSTGLTTLGAIDDRGQVEALRGAPSGDADTSPDFREQLRGFTENSPLFIQERIGELRALAAQIRRGSATGQT